MKNNLLLLNKLNLPKELIINIMNYYILIKKCKICDKKFKYKFKNEDKCKICNWYSQKLDF